MNNIRRPPTGQSKSGKKENAEAKKDAKAEKGYEAALDDMEDDYDDGGSSESDAQSDGDAGEETSTRMTRKGRVITKNKKKINRDALLKQQRKEALARQAQGRNAQSTLRNVGVKRTRMRNDNDEDEFLDDFDSSNERSLDMGDFSGGGGSDQDDDHSQNEQAVQDWAAEEETVQDETRSGFELNNVSDNNKSAIHFLQEFLERNIDDLQQAEKEKLQKMLEMMFQQCIKGLHHFPKESRKHQALGKSANVCKHALSALARDNIDDVKKLVAIITPQKRPKT